MLYGQSLDMVYSQNVLFVSDDVPQANRPEVLLGLIVDIADRNITVDEALHSIRFHGKTDYKRRQGHYYLNAGMILGLIRKNDGRYVLSRRGLTIATMNSDEERRRSFGRAVLETPLFARLNEVLDRDAEYRNSLLIVKNWLVSNVGSISASTAKRRASAVHGLLRFAWGAS